MFILWLNSLSSALEVTSIVGYLTPTIVGSRECHTYQKSTTANMGLSTKPFLLPLLLSAGSAKSVSEALIKAGQEISSCELVLGNSESCTLWVLLIPVQHSACLSCFYITHFPLIDFLKWQNIFLSHHKELKCVHRLCSEKKTPTKTVECCTCGVLPLTRNQFLRSCLYALYNSKIDLLSAQGC